MIINYHFGKSLKKYLKDYGITQAHIAKKIGITTAGLNEYFKSGNPRIDTQEKVLKALGITIETLYSIPIQFSEYELLMEKLREAEERERKAQKIIEELRSELIISQKQEIKVLKDSLN